ncbi:MAG: glucosamine-6-phosphate deaminase [Gammaproteobacteria bacterium]|nr:glucosamine-6-phosphate deaminase [Gammaproteobacteria bacterium]
MRVIERLPTPAALAVAAADVIARQLQFKPGSALALPTGNTPIGLYAELVRRHRAGHIDLSQAHLFNLDEYAGLSRQNARSYAAFIDRHLAEPLSLPPDRTRLLRGDASDLELECRSYDAAIAARGGIDLCVLGLGINGHIAFNEPGAAWNLTTHVVRLSATTRATHAAQSADHWQIPVWGISMGIRTILAARAVLLLVAGGGKDAAKDALNRNRIDENFPVTCLTDHPNLTVIELCARAELR